MKKLSEPKDKYSNAWTRWSQQQRSIETKEHNGGSSQIPYTRWSTYAGDQPVIAEAISQEVWEKVFSRQPAKLEVSRHIGNVLAPMLYHYAVAEKVSYYDWLTGSWKMHAKVYHEAQKKWSCFNEKYGPLWEEAVVTVKGRFESMTERWAAERKEREAKAAPVRAKRRAHARIRSVSTVPTSDTEVQDGGGS